MRTYIRDKTKGGCYFLTLCLENRQSNILIENVGLFRNAYKITKQNHDFTLEAMVLMPDHIHLMITLAKDSDNFSVIVSSLKSHFSRQMNLLNFDSNASHSRQKKRESGIWQRRFWEHKIRDDVDFLHHVEYIHYNPVKHGYSLSPKDWQFSTFHRFVQQGIYDEDWGGGVSPALIKLDYD
ncbi:MULTISPECIES: REP-associated tyrosine transposase [unclassified Moraxella]|uniref:REP-associated tyrosine transposase n=1 Tax=unclassified Moraxella TaxID=2685852 RepID=UPI003AF80904